MWKLVLFIILGSFTFAQEINKIDSKGKKQGVWEKKYEKSAAYEYKGQFKDDKPVGTFYYFYPSTKKKAIIVHQEKSTRSVATMYYETGVEMAFGIYKNFIKDSVWTYYGPSGKLSYKETFVKGKLNGKKTIYYVPEQIQDKSQRIAMVENYVNDVKTGEEIEYFEDGSVKSSANYINNLLEGKKKVYHPNGRVMMLENYKNGALQAWSYGYDEEGKLLGKRFFKNGVELKGKELDKWIKYCQDNKIDINQ